MEPVTQKKTQTGKVHKVEKVDSHKYQEEPKLVDEPKPLYESKPLDEPIKMMKEPTPLKIEQNNRLDEQKPILEEKHKQQCCEVM